MQPPEIIHIKNRAYIGRAPRYHVYFVPTKQTVKHLNDRHMRPRPCVNKVDGWFVHIEDARDELEAMAKFIAIFNDATT